MANIRVDVGYTIHDGSELKFRSPVDCSAITGLIVYYPGEDGNLTSKVFTLADAHGNNVGDIDHLFAENVVVKVILDVTTGMAFVQNADTNAYLEEQLAKKAPADHVTNNNNPHGVTASQVGARADTWMPTAADVGAAPAGFGLGETVKWIYPPETLANYIHSGFYSWSSGVTDAPFYAGSMIAIKRSPEYSYQIAFRDDVTRVEMAVRKLTKTDWTPWEWVNPPMVEGTEYRTTERCKGKPVYARLVNLGTMPNATSKTYQSFATGVDDIVSAEFTYKTSDTRYFNNPDISWYIGCYNNPYIVMTTTKDMSGCTGYLLCKYTKKAD